MTYHEELEWKFNMAKESLYEGYHRQKIQDPKTDKEFEHNLTLWYMFKGGEEMLWPEVEKQIHDLKFPDKEPEFLTQKRMEKLKREQAQEEFTDKVANVCHWGCLLLVLGMIGWVIVTIITGLLKHI